MEQFLLASHGSLARAMKETAAFLLGTNENVHCLCAYVDEASMNLEQMVGEWAAGRKTEEHWTVITDIFGGSVNNEFMKYAGDPGVNLVAGMSLPLVIGLLNQPGQVLSLIHICPVHHRAFIQAVALGTAGHPSGADGFQHQLCG